MKVPWRSEEPARMERQPDSKALIVEAKSRIERAKKYGSNYVNLSNLQLVEVPIEVGDVPGISNLDLSRNSLTDLPTWLLRLDSLKTLNLAHNRLATCPPPSVPGVVELVLSGNPITRSPDYVPNLAQLEILMMEACMLGAIPRWIEHLHSLKQLSLAGNSISSLTAGLLGLRSLSILDVSRNPIESLPPDIAKARRLNVLSLRDCQLTSVPSELAKTALTSIDLRGNPVPPGLIEISKDRFSFLAYLHKQSDGAVRQSEIKVLVVGAGNVGKSCLIDSLKGSQFDPNRRTTEWYEVGRDLINLEPDDAGSISISCWDFGGQKKYELTHQLFFSDHSVYIVVWRPRMGPLQCELEHWLDLVRTRAGDDAPILVVSTHADDEPFANVLDIGKLSRKYPGIRGFLSVSNKTRGAGNGIHALKQKLYKCAAPLVLQDYPAGYKQVRERINQCKLPAISFPEFVELCAPELGAEDARIFARTLNRLGDIVFFDREANNHENVVVLEPKWLGKAIGYAIDDAEFGEGSAVVDNSALFSVWKRHSDEGYREFHYPYFLWMMEKFDLSYRLLGDAYRSVIPQLIRREKPVDDLPFDPYTSSARDLELVLQWEFGEEPPVGLIPLLIARCYHMANPRDLANINWRNGFSMGFEGGARALVELDDRTLRVIVRDRHPRLYLRNIERAVQTLIEEQWRGIRCSVVIPCLNWKAIDKPCFGGIALDVIRSARDLGQVYLPCPICSRFWTITELTKGYSIDVRTITDQIASLGLSIESARELHELTFRYLASTGPTIFNISERAPGWANLATVPLRMEVFCEEPGEEHVFETYDFERSKEWVGRYRTAIRWASLIAKTLSKGIVAISDFSGAKETVGELYDQAKLGKDLLEALPEGQLDVIEAPSPDSAGKQPGELYAFHQLLEDLRDKTPPKAILSKLEIRQTRQVLWLCPRHALLHRHDPPRGF